MFVLFFICLFFYSDSSYLSCFITFIAAALATAAPQPQPAPAATLATATAAAAAATAAAAAAARYIFVCAAETMSCVDCLHPSCRHSINAIGVMRCPQENCMLLIN